MKKSVTPAPPTVNHLVPLYLADPMRRGKICWSDDDTHYRNHIQSHIWGLRPDEVTPGHVIACLPLHRASATRLQLIALVRGLFNWAKRRRRFKGQNPTEGIERGKFDNRRTQTLPRLWTFLSRVLKNKHRAVSKGDYELKARRLERWEAKKRDKRLYFKLPSFPAL